MPGIVFLASLSDNGRSTRNRNGVVLHSVYQNNAHFSISSVSKAFDYIFVIVIENVVATRVFFRG